MMKMLLGKEDSKSREENYILSPLKNQRTRGALKISEALYIEFGFASALYAVKNYTWSTFIKHSALTKREAVTATC